MKNAYGITEAKFSELRAIGQDTEINANVNFRALYNFSLKYIQHGRDLAKSGQKDEARNWLRYFQNVPLVEIFSYQTSVKFTHEELAKLTESLNQFNFECHPADVADWSTEIEAIREKLDYIIANLPRKDSDISQNVHRGMVVSPTRTDSFAAPFSFRQTTMEIIKGVHQ